MKLVHNVAQYCHCLAQGKVGSGFDVSSAVWGSQVYRKFGPDALEGLMTEEDVVSDHFRNEVMVPGGLTDSFVRGPLAPARPRHCFPL